MSSLHFLSFCFKLIHEGSREAVIVYYKMLVVRNTKKFPLYKEVNKVTRTASDEETKVVLFHEVNQETESNSLLNCLESISLLNVGISSLRLCLCRKIFVCLLQTTEWSLSLSKRKTRKDLGVKDLGGVQLQKYCYKRLT